MHSIIKYLLVSLLIISVHSYAENKQSVIKLDEQIIKDSISKEPQIIDPLTLSVRTVFEDNINFVGSAVVYILQPTGYKLFIGDTAPKEAKKIVARKIPAVARINRTMPILDEIQLLIGLNNTIVIDRENKLISFKGGN